jgi:hypothetical protein
MEALAAAEHESWSGWTRYMLPRIEKDFMEAAMTDSELVRAFDRFNEMPCVKRWIRQCNTPYADLSEAEKESDRDVVRKKLPVYRKRLEPIPAVGSTPGHLHKVRAWKVADDLSREKGLEVHTDAGGYPVLVVPRTYHPVRPHDAPVPDQTGPADDLVERMTTAVLGELDISHPSEPTVAFLKARISKVLDGGK